MRFAELVSAYMILKEESLSVKKNVEALLKKDSFEPRSCTYQGTVEIDQVPFTAHPEVFEMVFDTSLKPTPESIHVDGVPLINYTLKKPISLPEQYKPHVKEIKLSGKYVIDDLA